MRVDILGPLQATEDGAGFRLPGRKLRTVLAALALNPGRVVPSYQLIGELWLDAPPKNAENSLHAHIARLRKLLAAHVGRDRAQRLVRTADAGYLLDVPEEAVDAHRFVRLAKQARVLQRHDAAAAAAELAAALELWRGPALLDVGDGVICRTAAGQLEEVRLAALEDLIEARLSLGQHRALVPELERLTGRYPLRERFAEQSMVALYRCGRQADALEVYARARHRLSNELGLEPGLGLRATLQQVLRHDPRLWDGFAVTLPETGSAAL